VCSHPERTLIDQSLVGNESNRNVSLRFGPSIPALQRHRAHHLPQVLARAQRRTEQRQEATHTAAVGAAAQQRAEQEHVQALDVVRQLKAINGVALEIMAKAREAGDGDTALRAMDRIQRQIELQAKLLGELSDDRPQVNILLSPQWIALRSTLVSALADYPDALTAVAARLQAAEDEPAKGAEP
jgi:hypothetical protein